MIQLNQFMRYLWWQYTSYVHNNRDVCMVSKMLSNRTDTCAVIIKQTYAFHANNRLWKKKSKMVMGNTILSVLLRQVSVNLRDQKIIEHAI